MRHWLVKQEPESYSWDDLVKEGGTVWTGVRNFQARNNLRQMEKGDQVLFYHSGEEKQVVGIARVTKKAYPDLTAKEGDWSCVELAPIRAFANGVTLNQIKAEKTLKDIALVRNSRLSVMPLTGSEFEHLTGMGGRGGPQTT